eukprot:Gb_06042 [translate_table: standard]
MQGVRGTSTQEAYMEDCMESSGYAVLVCLAPDGGSFNVLCWALGLPCGDSFIHGAVDGSRSFRFCLKNHCLTAALQDMQCSLFMGGLFVVSNPSRCIPTRSSVVLQLAIWGCYFSATGCIQKWLPSSPVGGHLLGALLHGGVSQVRLVKAGEGLASLLVRFQVLWRKVGVMCHPARHFSKIFVSPAPCMETEDFVNLDCVLAPCMVTEVSTTQWGGPCL